MPSPFPGMDPYLEVHWRDVHARLIIYASDALQGVLPPSLRARVEERVLLETPQGLGEHPLYPDVRVVEYTSPRSPEARPETGILVAEPLLIETEPEPATETFLEIIDRASGNRVVTVIEFLSPSNKSPGPNREQYLRTQREVCSSDANLVEIDLNRFGQHTLAFPLGHLKPQVHTSYMACGRRAVRRGQAEVYPDAAVGAPAGREDPAPPRRRRRTPGPPGPGGPVLPQRRVRRHAQLRHRARPAAAGWGKGVG